MTNSNITRRNKLFNRFELLSLQSFIKWIFVSFNSRFQSEHFQSPVRPVCFWQYDTAGLLRQPICGKFDLNRKKSLGKPVGSNQFLTLDLY